MLVDIALLEFSLTLNLPLNLTGDQISMDFPAAELDTVATEGAAFDKVSAAVEKAASALKGKVVNIAWYKGFGAIVEIDESVSIEGIPIDTSFFDKEVAPFLLILTQPSSSADYNVYSRVFAPAVGVNEDPVVRCFHAVRMSLADSSNDRLALLIPSFARIGKPHRSPSSLSQARRRMQSYDAGR